MTTDAPGPLTDEELAELIRGHERMDAPFNTPGFCRRCSHFWPCPTSRLIADLRAARAEVGAAEHRAEAAEAAMGRLDQMLTEHVAAGMKRAAENAELRAEVERLRAKNAEYAAFVVANGSDFLRRDPSLNAALDAMERRLCPCPEHEQQRAAL